MIALLILLYVLQTNAMTVPTGCFVAAWTCSIIAVIAAAIKGIFSK